MKTYIVSLFSDSGRELWKKEFKARDNRDADSKAAKLVRPHLNKHDDAEDWVVEEKSGKRAKMDPSEELALRFLLAEDAFETNGKAKVASFDMNKVPVFKAAKPKHIKEYVDDENIEYAVYAMANGKWALRVYDRDAKDTHLTHIHTDKAKAVAEFDKTVRGLKKRRAGLFKAAKSNAKVVEVPNTYHKVVLQPAQAKRKKYPFEGYIDFQGIKIDVENAKGSTRSGTGPEGDWSTYMHAHYGEIRGTEGTDGDKLDVYVGDNHDSSIVVVVHQHNPWDGKYDEDKVVLGCESVEEAIGLYKKQYDRPGFYREGEHTAMPIGAFWRWVNDKNNKGKRVNTASKFTMSNVEAALKEGQGRGGSNWTPRVAHIDNRRHKAGARPAASNLAAVMWKKGYTEGSPGAINTAKNGLSALLSVLRAAQWNHLTSHWQIGGDSAYGDHLLFERLYDQIVGEVDRLAEKLVGTFGIAAVNAREQAKGLALCLSRWDIGCPIERGLLVERTLQSALKNCLDALGEIGQISLGMDDFLRTMANDHETHIYLLQQRQGGVKMASATASPKRAQQRRERAFQARCLMRFAARRDGFYPDVNDPERSWHHIGGDLEASYDGAMYVDIRGIGGSDHFFISKGALQNAEALIVNPFRMAAMVGTDTAAIYAIEPSQLSKLIEGGSWKKKWDGDAGGKAADKLIRQHGGAVFLTGGDGKFDVTIPSLKGKSYFKEEGLMKPYSTKGFDKAISKLAHAVITAGWWSIDNGSPGAQEHIMQGGETGLHNGDGPADLMDGAIVDIVQLYEDTWGRKPYMAELDAVWRFCANPKVIAVPDSTGLKTTQDAIDAAGAPKMAAVWKDRTKPDRNGRFDNAPLTPEEVKESGRAYIWLMDWEMDGGTLPRNIQRINDIRRRLKPAEVRELNDWFYTTAPGGWS